MTSEAKLTKDDMTVIFVLGKLIPKNFKFIHNIYIYF